MINFAKASVMELQKIFTDCNQKELFVIMDYVDDVIEKQDCLPFNMKEKYTLKKEILVNYVVSIFMSKNSVFKIYQKLFSTEVSKYVYQKLIWETDSLLSSEIVEKFHYKLNKDAPLGYGIDHINLPDELSLVLRTKRNNYYSGETDKLSLSTRFKKILRLVTPIPQDYDLEPIANINTTQYSYSNEDNVLGFITTIESMLENNLVEFGKTNEKPLNKSLNILKSSTTINEFYSKAGLNSFVADMLTRSFYFYYQAKRKFEKPEQNTLKNFILIQFNDNFSFFITRIFLNHLKKVKYDSYYSSQQALFNTLRNIVDMMPKENYVSVKNIINFCRYRNLNIDIEKKDKASEYFMAIIYDEEQEEDAEANGDLHYDAIVYEPMLKASLFYLGALGLLELQYNDPVSSHHIAAKGKPYISPWDSLEYVKLTKLGKYVFGFAQSYEYEKKEIEKKSIKFDEYKPIITVDKQDVLLQAKLEPYTEKQGEDRYILTHAKIFRDCKNKKALELKIDEFYKQIEKNPPQVFKDFLDEIMINADMLKKDSKHVVIELNNNKKLLNLFMKNKKLQEIVIKAQGYRIMVLKEDLPKLTKIVKENGFFIEF